MTLQQVASENSLELLEFLQRPESYPNEPKTVELRETRISWVFFAGRFAFKLKKPVRFDFLDFSTLELRKQACEAEVRLNRRLSPSVYRGVIPVCRSKSGHLLIPGDSKVVDWEVVDWLVKMRRLDDKRTLKALLTGPLPLEDLEPRIRMLAKHLAEFYATQAPLTVRTTEFRENLRRHIEDNERQLLQIASSAADRHSIRLVHSAQKRFLVTHTDLFDNRVRDGRIVDGHGDLRPEHLYLYNQPLVIDCVEFNAEYRTNDIVDELAFLAMECDRLGEPAVGLALSEAYARASNDIPPGHLMAFYKAYRACVRAKVDALRGQQEDAPHAGASLQSEREYLVLAENYVRDLGPRLLIVVGGLMGTGKSTLASQLGKLLSAEVVSSDIIRQESAGSETARPARTGFGQGEYSLESRLEIYRSLIAAAANSFASNDTVILDATFSTAAMRELAVELANSCGAQPLQVECTCPREVAINRIAERVSAGGSASEALPEFYDLQAAEAEPPLQSVPCVTVDTTLALGRQEAIVLERIRSVIP